MSALPYNQMIYARDKQFLMRLELAKCANTEGVRAASRRFRCARNTARLWQRRFNAQGPAGLRDRSRAPRRCPHKTSPYHEAKVLAAREAAPCFGPLRLKDDFALRPSLGAIGRILRQNNKARKTKKKSEKKNDLRAVKALYKPFERVQADTKVLHDIPAYYPQMLERALPTHQYTHRDVKSGALFIDYANELSTTYACLSTKRILAHLRRWGVSLADTAVKSDNGGEYGGGERSQRERGYHAMVQKCGARHEFNPPATPNANADVESSHRFIEEELFDLEQFRNRRDFFEKITTYQRWWNFARRNYSKGGKTPAEILEEQGVNPAVLLLRPADLDLLFRKNKHPTRVGQNLPVASEQIRSAKGAPKERREHREDAPAGNEGKIMR